jgi:hypothetical protein
VGVRMGGSCVCFTWKLCFASFVASRLSNRHTHKHKHSAPSGTRPWRTSRPRRRWRWRRPRWHCPRPRRAAASPVIVFWSVCWLVNCFLHAPSTAAAAAVAYIQRCERAHPHNTMRPRGAFFAVLGLFVRARVRRALHTLAPPTRSNDINMKPKRKSPNHMPFVYAVETTPTGEGCKKQAR